MTDRGLELATRAVDVYGFNSTARQVLIRTFGKLGLAEESAQQVRLLKDLTEPEVKNVGGVSEEDLLSFAVTL